MISSSCSSERDVRCIQNFGGNRSLGTPRRTCKGVRKLENSVVRI
jgi:hypothetical protein